MDAILNEHLINMLKTCNKPIEFLSMRIVLNCSAVLLGCKPASTITFNNSDSNSDILTLWDNNRDLIFKRAKLKFLELFHNNERVLVLVYDEKKLKTLISRHDISHFLNYLGYNSNMPLNDTLYILQQKFAYYIPHEIGIFLGLPLKDVSSYMGISRLSYSCTMGWKMYGNTEKSISLYKQYKECRNRIIRMLINKEDPIRILTTYPHNSI